MLKATFAHSADTDTIAEIIGGLLGVLAGSDWISTGWLSERRRDNSQEDASRNGPHTQARRNFFGQPCSLVADPHYVAQSHRLH